MSNNIQKDFEVLIKTLTTEISKEVLLEDLKNIRNTFNETGKNYQMTHQGYTREVNTMKEKMKEFDGYLSTAIKHTSEMRELNSSSKKTMQTLDQVLKVIAENKQAVLEKILQENEELFKKYRKQVAQLNEEEENRFLQAIQRELTEAERKVASLNADIKDLLVKTDYNRDQVLEDMLAKNIQLADEYQKGIREFNTEETKRFLQHLDQTVLKRVEDTENRLSWLFQETTKEMHQEIQIQKNTVSKIVKAMDEVKVDYRDALATLTKEQEQFTRTVKGNLETLKNEQNAMKKEISKMKQDSDTRYAKIEQDLKEYFEGFKAELESQRRSFYFRMLVSGIIIAAAYYVSTTLL